tara:strand:- start:856 stop:1545 length:690 start_codon:yes stop_codon:yes gene_type:complete
MAEDLAIDVGIPKDSEEFDSFVGCIENVLEYGCGYGDDWTEDILEKCRKSDLDIAKRVIEELEKPIYRQKKMKWWQSYHKHNRDAPRTVKSPRRDASRTKKRNKRPMSPMFERNNRKRPMSPMFERNNRNPPPRRTTPNRRAPTRDIPYERDIQYERNPRNNRKRPMSPMFDDLQRPLASNRSERRRPSRYSSVPEWPGNPPANFQHRSPPRRRSPPRNNRNKRRRFRR